MQWWRKKYEKKITFFTYKNTPCLALIGGVFCQYLGENWAGYNWNKHIVFRIYQWVNTNALASHLFFTNSSIKTLNFPPFEVFKYLNVMVSARSPHNGSPGDNRQKLPTKILLCGLHGNCLWIYHYTIFTCNGYYLFICGNLFYGIDNSEYHKAWFPHKRRSTGLDQH